MRRSRRGQGRRRSERERARDRGCEATQCHTREAEDAIVDRANAHIDSKVKSGDLDEDEAADLQDQVDDNLAFAIATSRTKTVASDLGITVAALKDGASAARKALIEAKIEKALKNGDIDADEATELKDELDDADLPGYKTVGYGGFDLGA